MKIKLFCITYAGGSASAYSVWNKHISDEVELISLELAGRGRRTGEPFYSDWNEAVEDIYSKLMSQVDENDEYSVYGHSMGCWIAFEVLDKIRRNREKLPEKVYFSANIPPHLEPKDEKISGLNDDDFADKIIEMGDTPKEIMTGAVRNFFLPVLRADYRLVEMYSHEERDISFDFDIHVLYGINDNIEIQELMEWKRYTNRNFYIHGLNGGHMFFKENLCDTTDYINATIAQ